VAIDAQKVTLSARSKILEIRPYMTRSRRRFLSIYGGGGVRGAGGATEAAELARMEAEGGSVSATIAAPTNADPLCPNGSRTECR
jgi:hypothetical protein